MKKIVIGVVAAAVVLIAVFYVFNAYIYNEKQVLAVTDHKDAQYRIDGASIQLKAGFAETEAVLGSASKITTHYFGNEYMTDLDNDGRKDIVFLLTQETGGSGIFYYVVAALNTERGYVGSDGYLLGDRIAPQTIEMSGNPRHKNVIVVNYADRAKSEPMTVQPSIGKSVYLKLDTTSMMWGIVEPNFEGEEDGVAEVWGTIYGTVLLGPTCPVVMNPPDPQCADKPYATPLVLTTPDGARVIKTFSSDAEGKFNFEAPAGEYAIRRAAGANILPYCQSNGTFKVAINNSVEVSVSCDTGIR